jgi:hypothetical protein
MTVLDDFRQKYPQYKDIPDGKLAAAIRKKYYADMPPADFYRKAGLTKLVGLSETPDTGLGSNVQNYLAGMGKSVVDNARGLGQVGAKMLGTALQPTAELSKLTGMQSPLVTGANDAYGALRQQQTQANATDAPLMDTKAGVAGNVSGQVMQAIGTGAALKGAGVIDSVIPQTYRGAALAGGAQGAVQPIDDTQGEGQRLLNTAVGAGGGVVGQALPAVAGATGRTIRGLIDPLTDSGQGRIVANTINRFGQGGNMTPAASAVPGVQPTLAEATGNPGIGQLQRAVTDSGAGDGTLNQFVQRGLENNAARVAAVRGVAGTPDDLAQAVSNRADAANVQYGNAMSSDNMRLSLL